MVDQGRKTLKDQVFAAYGGYHCATPGCKETRQECLQIDHIANDGAEHRRAIGRGRGTIYTWLRRHDFPPGFQVLCANCNLVKKIHGYVPPLEPEQ